MLGSRFRRVIVNRPNLRIPFPDRFADRLRGKTVVSVARRGKYLIVELSSGESLIMHLGMSGWFYVGAIGDRSREADPHDHVVFMMSSGQAVLFNDPRRFGFMDLAAAGKLAEYPSQGQEGVVEGRAPRSANRRRARQHLRERSAASRAPVATEEGIDDRDRIGGAEGIGAPSCEIDQGSTDERNQASRVTVPIGAIPGVRARRAAVPAERLRRNDQAHHAGSTIDLLLPNLSEVNRPHSVAVLISYTATHGSPTPRRSPRLRRRLRACRRCRYQRNPADRRVATQRGVRRAARIWL